MLTVAGGPVVSLTLVLPLIGAWHADVEVTLESVPEPPIVITDGTNSFTGAIVRSGFRGSRFVARIVGGAGGLGTIVGSAHYRNGKVRLLVGNILDAVKEEASSESDGATLEREVLAWSRAKSTAGTAISMLAAQLGVSWRVLPNGSVWVGPDVFPELDEPIESPELEPDPIDGSRVIATDQLSLRPGVTHAGERVKRVVHTSQNGTLRTQYWV